MNLRERPMKRKRREAGSWWRNNLTLPPPVKEKGEKSYWLWNVYLFCGHCALCNNKLFKLDIMQGFIIIYGLWLRDWVGLSMAGGWFTFFFPFSNIIAANSLSHRLRLTCFLPSSWSERSQSAPPLRAHYTRYWVPPPPPPRSRRRSASFYSFLFFNMKRKKEGRKKKERNNYWCSHFVRRSPGLTTLWQNQSSNNWSKNVCSVLFSLHLLSE